MRGQGVGCSVLCALLACATATASAHAAFPQTPPDDPLFDSSSLPNATSEQWDLASPAGGFDRGISVDRAWPLTTGRGVLITDLDLGVQLDHPDLANRWATNPGETGRDAGGRNRASNGVDDDGNGYVDDWRGWDFYARDNNPTSDTANNHGTNVAGVLGAATDNGQGVAGIAPGARILPLRTADNIIHQGVRVAQAIVYATDRGTDAISVSLGADSFPGSLRDAVRYAYRRGVVIAVAIGNEFHFHHHYPQLMDEVLAVGGINPDTANAAARNENLAVAGTDFSVKASYSNYGPHIDVVAPTQVPTTEWGSRYRKTWDGTSAATPHVAGTAGLVKARAKALGLRLSAGEVIQIIRQSADDLTGSAKGFGPGWDLHSGWGRVNAYRAVRRVARGRIPPDANITAPAWYSPRAGGVEVRGSVKGRSATSWTLELGTGEDPRSWRRIASGRGDGAVRRLAGLDAGSLPAGGHTLRLRATDANGNLGEDRAFFYALRDQRLHQGSPKELGTSGESSPTLADLGCDGDPELVLATSDGKLNIWSGRTGRRVSGWPRTMRATSGAEPTAARIGPVRSGMLATPAIGDVAGDSRPEVIAAGLDGRVYGWSARGRRLAGFPFRIALHGTAERGKLDGGVYASPALADLDRDGKLDIVFGAADQRIYAIDGRGRALPGWPVLARDGDDVAKILSSPAIADLDGDGSPEVVEGTAEAYGTTPLTTGRVHAFDARGRRVPGWPVKPPALAADSIPLVGEGVPVSPSVADTDGDGDDEVAVAAFTGEPELYAGDGTRLGGPGVQSHFQFAGRGASSPATAPSVLALGSNSAFGRTTRSGPLRYFGGVVDSRLAVAQQLPATRVRFEHLMGGWDARSGEWLDDYPIPIEGWQLPTAPAIADVDGDRRAEVIAASSGNLLHAYRRDGSEPDGWPKQTGGWILASPAAGDVDGDGRTEVVAVTRDGWLFVWDTPARARDREWPSFRHDERNTGNYGTSAARRPRACARAAGEEDSGRRRTSDRDRGGGEGDAKGSSAGGETDSDGSLPFTGLLLLGLLLLGAVLVASGSALRRVVRRARPRQ